MTDTRKALVVGPRARLPDRGRAARAGPACNGSALLNLRCRVELAAVWPRESLPSGTQSDPSRWTRRRATAGLVGATGFAQPSKEALPLVRRHAIPIVRLHERRLLDLEAVRVEDRELYFHLDDELFLLVQGFVLVLHEHH